MGLAASQARFLGITLRKANCEFKSTELAQQRLELTNQMTDIAQEYANALNSTKLVWCNDAVTDSFGNPGNYGLSYSLMMMPSAANDYNPYMFSTRSGAIVLNAKYADAAEYAGISMGGGTPSQAGRDRFIAALANQGGLPSLQKRAKGDADNNVITKTTYEILTGIKQIDSEADVSWHYSAGMGSAPKNKGVADTTTLIDLIQDKNIGGKTVDWLQIYKAALGIEKGATQIEYDSEYEGYQDAVSKQKLNYINYKNDAGKNPYSQSYVAQVESTAKNEVQITESGITTTAGSIMRKFQDLENKIDNAKNEATRIQYQNELELLKKGYEVSSGADGRARQPIGGDAENTLKYPLYWSIYEQTKAKSKYSATVIKWNNTENTHDANSVSVDSLFYTGNDGIGGAGSNGNKGINLQGDSFASNRTLDYYNILTLCVNDSMIRSAEDIKGMTIADLLTENVTIIAQNTPPRDGGASYSNASKTMEVAAKAMLESIASVFGYGHIGTGLNVDTESDIALTQALIMTEKRFLSSKNAVNGDSYNDDSLLYNSAYTNAQNYNRMGTINSGDTGYAAINLSNMVSAFLTYYDNFLRGSDSGYMVSKSNLDDRTNFVTDDPNYIYVTNTQSAYANDEKIADFFNQLYNNICEHGWRYDDMVQDSEYLESAVKDGRYQMMALNNDGYFYQMRYNEISYMEEVQDQDAIARAESDYQTKKAQITFKEDQIDVKTKKLDAEITELNTEINSVQNIISKSIEKTFSMFSN